MNDSKMSPATWKWKPLGVVSVVSVLCIAAQVPRHHPVGHPVDPVRSTMTVLVYKSGILSAFAHNHEIKAPVTDGFVDNVSNNYVTILVDARELKVLDPDVNERTRSEIEKTMHSEKVLDSARYPSIEFRSIVITAMGNSRDYIVTGNLTLHGKTHPITLHVVSADGHYRGNATIKQSDFGITPIHIGGGAIRVKDEVKIEFDIVLQ